MFLHKHIRILILFVCCFAFRANAAGDTLRVQLKWWDQFQFAGYYAADIKGYYKEAGLRVKLMKGDMQHNPITEVMSGRAQFGITGSDLLVHYAKGAPVIALAALFQHSPYAIFSLREKNINSPSDLIGKTIMVAENQGWVELQAMLIKEGIPVNLLHIQTHSWKNTDLTSGKVDAMTGYYSVELHQLKKMGVDPMYISPVNYGIDFYGDILFSLRSTVNNKPEIVSRFRKASFKGWEYAMTHREEIADYILSLPGVKQRGVTKEDLLNEAEAMSKLILPEMIEIGHMNEGRWQHILDVHKSLRLVPSETKLDGFVYDETQSLSSRLIRDVAYILVSVLLVLLAIVLYSLSLRRAVNKRTAELQVEIDQKGIAQQQLHLSEERLEMATRAAGLGIWDWDIEKETVYYNDMWKTMLGYQPGELDNSFGTFINLLHPDERELLLKQLDEHIDGKKSNYQAMIRLLTKDRKWKWVLTMSKASQRNAEGKAIRLSGVHLDIEDIKKKEIELRDLSQELMNSNRELQQFAYITSHNLRAPVANLLSLLKLFREEELSEKNTVFFQKIATCVNKMHSTLDDLNDILSSRVHKADGEEEIFFEERLNGIINSISEEIRKQQAVITYDFSKASAICYSRKVIDSIFLNLLTNAIKYKKENIAPAIHVSTEEDGEYIILSVADNGSGIDMNKYGNKIFGLYQRFHENKIGKGLGLYLIKNQVESLQGKVAVESIVNRGTKFYVFLKKL